ncbi:hypothetical protein [Sphingomonas crocodyli]|nr:hypothetical protein [Sphingomonas crocodyli]
MMIKTTEDDASETPLTDTVGDELPDVDDAVEEIKETGEPFGGNFA